MTTIANTPLEDRPREKLLANGPEYLTESELLAIVLATSGQRGVSVLDIAKEIIVGAGGSLRQLEKMELEDLKKHKGIGNSKAILIKAIFELSRRHEGELPSKKMVFKSPSELAKHFIPKFRNKTREIFMALLFDSHHHLLKKEIVNIGSIMNVLVEPRAIFTPALSMGASSVIMLHNHPSGNTSPSESDFILTEKLVKAGEMLRIPVVDHLILGEDSFYSFRENNKI